jgi:hypothetical protein
MNMKYAMIKHSFAKMAAAALVMVVGFSSCKDDDKVTPVDQTKVGVVNLLDDVSKINVHYAGKKVNTAAIQTGAFSNYISLKAANDNLVIFEDTKTDTLTKKKFDFKANQSYTAFVYGSEDEAHIEVFTDNLAAPASGKAKIRFANFANGKDGLNLFIGTATTASISDVDFKEVKGFVEVVPASNVAIKVRAQGAETDLTQLAGANLQAGKIYTVFLTKVEEDGEDEFVVRMVANN